MRRRFMACGAAAVIVAAALAAGREAPCDPVDDEAKLHYKQGVTLFQDENYKAALAEFLKSYELKPNWKFLNTIGICYFNIGKFIDARTNILDYLDKGGAEVPADKKAQAEDLLAQIAKLTAEIKVDANILDARIFIDGKEIGKTPMKLPYALEAGVYTVTIEAEGYETFRKDITVGGGDKKVIEVAMAKKSSSGAGGGAGGTAAAAKDTAPVGAAAKRKHKGLLIGAATTGALALGTWVAAAVVGVMVKDKHDELDKCHQDPACPDGDLVSEGNTLTSTFNYGLLPLAAVLTVTSIALGAVTAVEGKKLKKGSAAAPRLTTVGIAPLAGGDAGLVVTAGGTF